MVMSLLGSLRFFQIAVLLGGLAISPTTGRASLVEVVLGQLKHAYRGLPIEAPVHTVPPGAPVALVYRNLSLPAPVESSETVFDNTPVTLPLSYSSLSFSSQKVDALGNYVRLGGNARKAESCGVIMVNWATAAQYPALAAVNPAGYLHPITVTLYAVGPDMQFKLLTDVTRTVLVPWRPELLPNGQPYPFHGTAFRINLDFPQGITLPEQVMVMVSYNTGASGFDPIGIPGPYDQLNVALGGTIPSVGSDLNADVVLRVTKAGWFYPNSGWAGLNGPIVGLKAGNSVSKAPPVAPGNYEVTATAGDSGTEGTVQGTLTIAPPTLESWQQSQFSATQMAAGEAAVEADPDGDGYTNFAEYAMGSNPNSRSENPPLAVDLSAMTITLVRPRWLTGVRYIAEESPDLATWTPAPLAILSSTLQNETVQASCTPGSGGSSRNFLRIRFTP